jgi:hypothetical protein
MDGGSGDSMHYKTAGHSLMHDTMQGEGNLNSLERLKKRSELLSTMMMIDEFLGLVKEADQKRKACDKGVKSLVATWLRDVETKMAEILKQAETHIHTWACVKLKTVEDDALSRIKRFFDSEIETFERGYMDADEEFEVLMENVTRAKRDPSVTDESVGAAVVDWQHSITEKLVDNLQRCRDYLYNKIRPRLRGEARYINDFFALGIETLKHGKRSPSRPADTSGGGIARFFSG